MATVVRPRPIRVGCAAGAQSVYTGRGGDVRGERNAAGDRLRVRSGRRAAAAGDAGLRMVREKPCRVSAGEATALRSGGGRLLLLSGEQRGWELGRISTLLRL